jgi:hypothetical protein
MNGEWDVIGENYGVWSEFGTDQDVLYHFSCLKLSQKMAIHFKQLKRYDVFKITQEGEERHEEEKNVDKSIGRYSWGPAGSSSRGHGAGWR